MRAREGGPSRAMRKAVASVPRLVIPISSSLQMGLRDTGKVKVKVKVKPLGLVLAVLWNRQPRVSRPMRSLTVEVLGMRRR